jgi:hypothetical protein
MPAWQYRCKSCGNVHEAPLRPGGTVYLRCLTTREWAWYEASSFRTPSEPRGAAAAAPARGGKTAARSIGRGSARSDRKSVARRATKGARKKRR